MSDPEVWAFRALWATLPLTGGPLLDAALAPTSGAIRTTAALGAWILWGLVVLASLVPHVVTLTTVRVVAPAAVPAAVWAAATGEAGTVATLAGLVAATLAAAAALAPGLGARFVDGSSYGDERRLPLRAPVVVAAGPVPLAWLAVVAGVAAGPLLLAGEQWVAGSAALAVGLPLATLGIRALHRLALRWLVFVPAGVVVHDHLALREPVLLPTELLVAVGPAPVGTTATDLTLATAGTPLRIALGAPVRLTTGDGFGTRRGEDLTVAELLVAPGLPGRAVRIAAERGLPVG